MNKELIQSLVEKSKQSIEAAEYLLEKKFTDFSTSRSYYSMFYLIEAVLLTKNLSFSKHSGVISAFGKEFIKTKIFDEKFHKYILEAFQFRNEGDYGASYSIEFAISERILSNSKELLSVIANYIKNLKE